MKSISVYPDELWEYFQKNKPHLKQRYDTIAEDGDCLIHVSADEDGSMILMAEDALETAYETAETEEEAIEIYSFMLDMLEPDAEELPDKDDDDFIPAIRAAAYGFCGVLTGGKPDEAILDDEALEDVAYQLAWYIKGRYDIESLLA